MTSLTLIESVCGQFVSWHIEGRHLPHYKKYYGKTYLCWLLGMTEEVEPGAYHEYETEALQKRLSEQFCNALLGPHGWAFYRVLVIRRGMEDENENMEITNARS